jgi:hypothetical protein
VHVTSGDVAQWKQTCMRAEDPRSEPDIEWPGLAADSDGRSIVARSYRDIANAILADQSEKVLVIACDRRQA